MTIWSEINTGMCEFTLQAPPFTITNLVAGTEYEFQVSAKNAIGFSDLSEMSKSVVTTETGLKFYILWLI